MTSTLLLVSFARRTVLVAAASVLTTVTAHGQTALDQFGPAVQDADIVTTVTPVLATVTLSTAGQVNFAAYSAKLLNQEPNNVQENLAPVYFLAETNVVDGFGAVISGQNAVFDFAGFSLPVGCAIVSSTKILCTFLDGLNGIGAFKDFVFTVQTPSNGDKIVLKTQTKWREFDEGGSVVEATAPFDTPVDLIAPDPTKVATFLPAATGGTVSTGTQGCTAANGCIATQAEPFVTFVRVPKSTTVNVNQILPALTTDNAFSDLKIPGLFGTPTSPAADLLVITFRRHKSVIGSGNGSLGDALLILHERIFYQGATTTGTLDTDFRQVYPCLITGGPVAATGSTPGRPCIASRKVYNIFNSPNPKAQWLGTHEWIIHANDNGGYRVQPGA